MSSPSSQAEQVLADEKKEAGVELKIQSSFSRLYTWEELGFTLKAHQDPKYVDYCPMCLEYFYNHWHTSYNCPRCDDMFGRLIAEIDSKN